MKKLVVTMAFLGLYFLGVAMAWHIPALKSTGLTVVFALVWFFVVSKAVSCIAAELGWTEPKPR